MKTYKYKVIVANGDRGEEESYVRDVESDCPRRALRAAVGRYHWDYMLETLECSRVDKDVTRFNSEEATGFIIRLGVIFAYESE